VAAVSAAPGETVSTERAEVSYRTPDGFTEMQRSPHERREWLDELGRHVAKRTARVVPKGQRLLVSIGWLPMAMSRPISSFLLRQVSRWVGM
jgi:hypothetical protein